MYGNRLGILKVMNFSAVNMLPAQVFVWFSVLFGCVVISFFRFCLFALFYSTDNLYCLAQDILNTEN